MRIALGSDERTPLTDFLVEELTRRGHDLKLIGPLAGMSQTWPAVGREVGAAIASGDCDNGIVCCYTGTGVSIAANKIAGIRAALCQDAQTAAGARKWNDANVLALSLRTITSELAREILDAWFSTEFPAAESVNVDQIETIHQCTETP